jgi:hypothetical protein
VSSIVTTDAPPINARDAVATREGPDRGEHRRDWGVRSALGSVRDGCSMNPTYPVWGPLASHAEVEEALATLNAGGFPRRYLGVVDLQPRPSLERDPLTRWALATIGRETLRTVLLSLPILVWVNVALLMLMMSHRPSLAVWVGLAAGVGASPLGGLVGFALAWSRWGYLAKDPPEAPAGSGFAVVAARGALPAAPVAGRRNPTAGDRLVAAAPWGER